VQHLFTSIKTLLVLASSLRLLATLDAGALIMLSLTDLSNHTGLGTAALETLQCAVDGLAVLYMDLRHLYFPPSEVSGYLQDTLRAITEFYGVNNDIIRMFSIIVKGFF
jgi:hypothetical protein